MRNSLKTRLFLLSTAALLAACSGEVEDTRPGQPVKTRQVAFKQIISAFEPMGVMLRQNRYEADKFLKLANELVARRDAPWSHFAADTNYPPTKATAEVWLQPEQFARDRDSFLSATDQLLAAAQKRDKNAVDATYKAVYETCQNCHRTFKKR